MKSTTGYSGTPLIQKLGIKPEHKVKLIHQPDDYFSLLGQNIKDQFAKEKDAADLVHLFVKDKKEFEKEMKALVPFIKKNPEIIIWVSWYKKSSGISTDITEDIIRDYALNNSLVDVKVCAVSDAWSGLKLVVPKKLR